MVPKLKKMSLDPFCCSKLQCKRIFVLYHLLHVSLPHFTVVLCMCTIVFFNHYKPHLIVTHVNNWSGSLLNGSPPSFFCSVNETSELVAFSNTPPPTHSECYPDCDMFHIKVSFKSLEKVKHFYLSKCIQIKAILIFVMKPGTSS